MLSTAALPVVLHGAGPERRYNAPLLGPGTRLLLPAVARPLPPAVRLNHALRLGPTVICASCESRHAAATSSTGREGFKAVSTVSREVAANGGRRSTGRGGRISGPASRPGGPRAASWPALQLAAQVAWLREWWSPVQISRRLQIEFPDDPMMHVSHETIYQALYVQGRGELRRELARCLRSGRARRRPRGRDGRAGHIRAW